MIKFYCKWLTSWMSVHFSIILDKKHILLQWRKSVLQKRGATFSDFKILYVYLFFITHLIHSNHFPCFITYVNSAQLTTYCTWLSENKVCSHRLQMPIRNAIGSMPRFFQYFRHIGSGHAALKFNFNRENSTQSVNFNRTKTLQVFSGRLSKQ